MQVAMLEYPVAAKPDQHCGPPRAELLCKGLPNTVELGGKQYRLCPFGNFLSPLSMHSRYPVIFHPMGNQKFSVDTVSAAKKAYYFLNALYALTFLFISLTLICFHQTIANCQSLICHIGKVACITETEVKIVTRGNFGFPCLSAD